ncbi:MAG: DNA mismatch repair protein [Elusimicrobia bacterium ADurb.Bin231]|nr:MAG: DNA mismatch repair protein [Elusimicrobia bacterium ADurb.Bin231]
MENMDKIPVTVDKSHLVTIGERLYTESVELLRELVNNAYDADASDVRIILACDEITVMDNGTGMDLDGLKQYFNIGSSFKKENPKSPKFGRSRIGEFGIGKFSVLSACEHFEVFTKKADFAATVVFDKSVWKTHAEEWHLPMRREYPEPDRPDGTKVTLKGLKKKFEIETVEKRLIETLPLKAPDFCVYLNGIKLVPRHLSGRKIPFLEGTICGIVHGEIVILPASITRHEEAGVLVRVKNVAVRRLSFGIEAGMLARITGEVNADFLPLTSDRNDFIRQSMEFDEFCKVMDRIATQAKEELFRQSDNKENSRVKRALKEVIHKIESALMKNKEWCPQGLLPVGGPGGTDVAGIVAGTGKSKTEPKTGAPELREKRSSRIRRPHLKQLSPSALIKKMTIGRMNLALVVDHFGPEGPESFLEGEIIYINRDHPLYTRESRNRERHIMNVTRLICQEISLMSMPKDARMAYERQSKLLKDAFIV